MNELILSDKGNGALKEVKCDDITISFNEELGPKFYIENEGSDEYVDLQRDGNAFVGVCKNLKFDLQYNVTKDYIVISTEIKNISNTEFQANAMGIKVGINTDMNQYPEWNNIFFPTMLRCEKTHFCGYFMTPKRKIISIVSKEPIASYSYDYNTHEKSFGHRIITVNFDFMKTAQMPDRYPIIPCKLKAGEKIKRKFYLSVIDEEKNYYSKINNLFGIPFIFAKKYTVEKNEAIELKVFSNDKYDLTIIAPDGSNKKNGDAANIYGLYTIKVKTESGYEGQSYIYCRKAFDWYLNRAREQAILKPPHATTHTESWYNLFSGYLAGKHYPDKELDEKIEAMFTEIMPLMYDFENAKALVIPDRIQNIAMLISLLVDRYEFDPKKNEESLRHAVEFADVLMDTQKEDGAFYRGNTHYTCVIYIAKSMLELWYAEKDKPEFRKYAIKHYKAVKLAVDNLVEKLDNIDTEGEKVFEDGMVSCASLQIGMFALTLKEAEREPYIKAAEYMISLHRCLENNIVSDCRMRGCSLRFWEAQYDVQIKANLFSSPHGWTAWTVYAKYYLYLLTGKVNYLIEMMDALGACLQLMDDDGNLRWAFVTDPCVTADVLVPNETKPIDDGYESVSCTNRAYEGKYVKKTFGEEYIEMISGWYRTGMQRVTGGFNFCPLILAEGNYNVNSQGGCCDNDVHEIFKCLEETVLDKAFVAENDHEIIAYNCTLEKDGNILNVYGKDIKYLNLNVASSYEINFNNKKILNSPSRVMLEL